MERLEKKLQKEFEKIRMRPRERTDVRERLLAYMEYHPLPETTRRTPRHNGVSRVFAPYADQYFFIPLSSWQMRGVVGALAMLLIVGIPLSAEYAVPGDVLYAMKVRVNEEVRGSLSFSSYDKVAWETHRVERRIAEARLLAKEGKLTEAVEAQITETVKEHTASAQKELAVLRLSDADEAAVAQVVIESAFEVQSAVLSTDVAAENASSTTGGEQIRALALVMKDAQASLSPSEPDVASLTSYERFNAEVEEATTRARDLHASLQSSVTEEEGAEIKRRLEDIDRKLVAVHASYDASSTGVAIQGLKDILSDTQKVIAFMTDIDVRNSVALEELVPKELTLDERVALVRIARDEIAKGAAIAETRLASSTDRSLSSKVRSGIEEVKRYVNTIDAGLAEGGSIEASESAEVAATALVRDLLLMTDHLAMPDSTPPAEPESVGTSTEAVVTGTTTPEGGVGAKEVVE